MLNEKKNHIMKVTAYLQCLYCLGPIHLTNLGYCCEQETAGFVGILLHRLQHVVNTDLGKISRRVRRVSYSNANFTSSKSQQHSVFPKKMYFRVYPSWCTMKSIVSNQQIILRRNSSRKEKQFNKKSDAFILSQSMFCFSFFFFLHGDHTEIARGSKHALTDDLRWIVDTP